MGTVFPCSQLLYELGPLEVCQGEFPCHLPGTSGFWLSCMLQAGSFSSSSFLLLLQHWSMWKPLKNKYLPPAVGKILLGYGRDSSAGLGCLEASTFPTAK